MPPRSFGFQLPGTVPTLSGWFLRKPLDPRDHRHRRTVAWNRFERRGKCLLRLVPAPRPVGREAFLVARSQRLLRRRQFALLAHDLVDRLRLALADHHEAID